MVWSLSLSAKVCGPVRTPGAPAAPTEAATQHREPVLWLPSSHPEADPKLHPLLAGLGWHTGPCWHRIGDCLWSQVVRGPPAPSEAGVTPIASVPATVLRGLIRVRSPHLEELLTALFSAASALPASRPVAVVSSLLLQEEEPLAAGQQDTDGSR